MPVGGESIFQDKNLFSEQDINSARKNLKQNVLKQTIDNTTEESTSQITGSKSSNPVNAIKHIDVMSSKSNSSRENSSNKNLSKVTTEDVKVTRNVSRDKHFSLFDDDDNLFNDDLFSAPSTKTYSSGLFDDDDVVSDGNKSTCGLPGKFSLIPGDENKVKNLFEDSDEEMPVDEIQSKNNKSNLSGDKALSKVSESANSSNTIFEKGGVKKSTHSTIDQKSLFSLFDERGPKPLSLFDDTSEDEDILPVNVNNDQKNHSHTKVTAHNTGKEVVKHRNLFDDEAAINSRDEKSEDASSFNKDIFVENQQQHIEDYGSDPKKNLEHTNVFDDDDITRSNKNVKNQRKQSKSIPSLFSDDEGDSDDLFSLNKPKMKDVSGGKRQSRTKVEHIFGPDSLFGASPNTNKLFDTSNESEVVSDVLATGKSNLSAKSSIGVIRESGTTKQQSASGVNFLRHEQSSNYLTEIEPQQNRENDDGSLLKDGKAALPGDEYSSLQYNLIKNYKKENIEKDENYKKQNESVGKMQSQEVPREVSSSSEKESHKIFSDTDMKHKDDKSHAKECNNRKSADELSTVKKLDVTSLEFKSTLPDVGSKSIVKNVENTRSIQEHRTVEVAYSDEVDEVVKSKSSHEDVSSRIPLFDSIPPPDVDDWETRSENNLFDDDPYLSDEQVEGICEPTVSVFDNEPPSLVYDEGLFLGNDTSDHSTRYVLFV